MNTEPSCSEEFVVGNERSDHLSFLSKEPFTFITLCKFGKRKDDAYDAEVIRLLKKPTKTLKKLQVKGTELTKTFGENLVEVLQEQQALKTLCFYDCRQVLAGRELSVSSPFYDMMKQSASISLSKLQFTGCRFPENLWKSIIKSCCYLETLQDLWFESCNLGTHLRLLMPIIEAKENIPQLKVKVASCLESHLNTKDIYLVAKHSDVITTFSVMNLLRLSCDQIRVLNQLPMKNSRKEPDCGYYVPSEDLAFQVYVWTFNEEQLHMIKWPEW